MVSSWNIYRIGHLAFIFVSQQYDPLIDLIHSLYRYALLSNRTNVDREIEDLRRRSVLRIFKVNTARGDLALIPTAAYISRVGFEHGDSLNCAR